MTTTLKTASFAFQKCFRCHLGFSTDSPPLLFESVSVALPCVRCTHTSEVPIWRLAYSIGCIRLEDWWKQIGWLSGILNSSQKILPWWWFGCRCLQLVPVLISTRISFAKIGNLLQLSQSSENLFHTALYICESDISNGKIAEPLMLRSPSKTKSHRHMTPQIPGSTRQLFSWRARSQSLARNEAMISENLVNFLYFYVKKDTILRRFIEPYGKQLECL